MMMGEQQTHMADTAFIRACTEGIFIEKYWDRYNPSEDLFEEIILDIFFCRYFSRDTFFYYKCCNN